MGWGRFLRVLAQRRAAGSSSASSPHPSPRKDPTGRKEKAVDAGPLPLGTQILSSEKGRQQWRRDITEDIAKMCWPHSRKKKDC
ncbi:uncharacterized protein LOC102434019 [Myotis lucifugus]|uniref:uncharacterized protein LOC102434019 n=1 Tax=Myotis lucifugus TaxID=59463 RepID=UPI000CCC4554|nr:uncharacterized protein LOC102434019 [Myotis lucifugus]